MTNQRHISALARTSRRNHQVLNVYLYKRNIRYHRGWVLFWAAWNGRQATARCIIEAGAILNQRLGDRRETALLWAAQSCQVDMVAYLIAKGADPNVRDSRGYNAMQWAVETDQVPLARLLMENGVNLDDTCKKKIYEGATALHVASHMGHHGIMNLLLASGFEVNARDENGNTPLHWAIFETDHIFQFFGRRRQWAYGTNVATVKLLLDHNADLECRNICGDRPKEQVQKYHFNKAIQHLFDDDSFLFDTDSQAGDMEDEGVEDQETLQDYGTIAESPFGKSG